MQSAASEVFDDAPSTWHDNRHVVPLGSAADRRRFVLGVSEQRDESRKGRWKERVERAYNLKRTFRLG